MKRYTLFHLQTPSEEMMEPFDQLLKIADKLLGENGCPWDREQTFYSLQPYLLEETHELLEAIDSQSPEGIAEELGDVFYALVFIAKLGEIQGLFTMAEALSGVGEKLIRRHPHIFGEVEIASSDDVVKNWEAIKKQEMEGKGRKTILDGIPPSLPALPRCQKILHKLKRAKSGLFPKVEEVDLNEEEVGERFWRLIAEAESSGVDAESALRRFTVKIMDSFTKENTGD